jgi:hypothetical protein
MKVRYGEIFARHPPHCTINSGIPALFWRFVLKRLIATGFGCLPRAAPFAPSASKTIAEPRQEQQRYP